MRAMTVGALLISVLTVAVTAAAQDIALNGGAEEAAGGVPAHWTLYGSGRFARIGQADEPGGPLGQKLMFSFIEVQPVFETR